MTPSALHGPQAGLPVVLEHGPQVLSWGAAGTWAQQRLVPYREEIATSFARIEGDFRRRH